MLRTQAPGSREARRATLGASLSALGASLVVASCITTPASETGYSAKAKALELPACGEQALIEDAEDGDSRVLVRDGRGGYWFVFTDSEGSTIDPPQGQFTMASPGRAGSKYAARMKGRMAGSGTLYAGMGLSLADPRGAYDASKYDGVSFWAKGPGRVRFEMPDGNTAPEGGVCKDCYNDFGVVLAFEPEWRKYTIPFEWLQQRPGWGEPHAMLATDRVFAMEWEFNGAGRDYEIWIDDIAFVCDPEKAR